MRVWLKGERMSRTARSPGLIKRSNTSRCLCRIFKFCMFSILKNCETLVHSSLCDLCKHGVMSGTLGQLRAERREGGGPGPEGWAL